MRRGQVAAAVGVGYLLGRTKKMRLAMMGAGAGLAGKLGGGPRQLLREGYKRIAATPEVSKLTDSVRGELAGAARSAAMTAATSRIESLNSKLLGQMDVPKKGRDKDEDDSDEQVDEQVDEQDDEQVDEDDYQDEEPDEESRPARSRSTGGSTRSRTRSAPQRRARR